MKDHEMLPFLSSITVMKTTTGSVTVHTHKGPILLGKSCQSYKLAETPEEVSALLATRSNNLSTLLNNKLISLVF